MNNKIQNEMSDAQLDAISGGCYSHDCDEGHRRHNECDDSWKKSCGDEDRCKPRRDYDDCRPSYRHRCG